MSMDTQEFLKIFFTQIMEKIKKASSFRKIISMTLVISFLFTNLLYGIDISKKSTLRVPLLGNNDRLGRVLIAANKKLILDLINPRNDTLWKERDLGKYEKLRLGATGSTGRIYLGQGNGKGIVIYVSETTEPGWNVTLREIQLDKDNNPIFIFESEKEGVNRTRVYKLGEINERTGVYQFKYLQIYFNRSLTQLEFRSGNIDIERLGKPTVIFDDDVITPGKSSTGEYFYLRAIFKGLGISVDSDLGMQLEIILLELITNSLHYRLTKQKEAIHLKVISYSSSGEDSDVKKTIRFTIEQKSSRDSDWQELLREKAGFDNRGGSDYLQDSERRTQESINRWRTKRGLLNVARLMQNNHPVLLRYVRSLIEPYPVVTDFYYEVSSDKSILDLVETLRSYL